MDSCIFYRHRHKRFYTKEHRCCHRRASVNTFAVHRAAVRLDPGQQLTVCFKDSHWIVHWMVGISSSPTKNVRPDFFLGGTVLWNLNSVNSRSFSSAYINLDSVKRVCRKPSPTQIQLHHQIKVCQLFGAHCNMSPTSRLLKSAGFPRVEFTIFCARLPSPCVTLIWLDLGTLPPGRRIIYQRFVSDVLYLFWFSFVMDRHKPVGPELSWETMQSQGHWWLILMIKPIPKKKWKIRWFPLQEPKK